ncbi:MAG: hypothetical protein DVB28_002238 [Verrucomicrobia bacterium]|nr:MAG: hypothetical protein DVB28_002238 [Verrucomicrobiota bacterium]
MGLRDGLKEAEKPNSVKAANLRLFRSLSKGLEAVPGANVERVV